MSVSGKSLHVSDFDLIYGIGNVGRQDDGLGWALVDELESLHPEKQLIRHYQLFWEDAALLHGLKRVLFIDACKRDRPDPIIPHAIIEQDLESGFAVEKIQAKMDISFTSHSMSLPTVAAMCELCYQSCPDIWLLSVQGYEWELQLGLTERAQQNLTQALRFITEQGVRSYGKPVFSEQSDSDSAGDTQTLLDTSVSS
ncbi:hydrogenase maturation protease [Candidatus Haliotispira prima]|uniref:Hydrogenase maturation protease n=1 Tax=Candidatus Haliotispira prima TaxID=3034016 RepID=A0ABY8MHU4_9SPIO|nr:hydrogenase maturation protease [Candidatus Haliotispira prima]